MTKNKSLWDSLCETDPAYTKKFKSFGRELTDISPQYRWMKLTEAFGAAGKGWGVETYTVDTRVMEHSGEVMVQMVVVGYYMLDKTKHLTPPGFGQDFIVKSIYDKLKTDDEGMKKAFTDALGNAFKYVGLGADVYLGLYDDSKYVNSLAEKFGGTDDKAPAKAPEKPAKVELPPIPEGREHLAAITKGKFLLTINPDAETSPDTVEFYQWYISTLPDLATLIEVCNTPQPLLGEATNGGGANPVIAGCATWAKGKLSGIGTDAGLKDEWQKMAGVVNGIKNTSPLAYEGIVAGFKQIRKEIKDGF